MPYRQTQSEKEKKGKKILQLSLMELNKLKICIEKSRFITQLLSKLYKGIKLVLKLFQMAN